MEIFLGFDFYGAGNIGDDLMLSGFLNIISQHIPAKLSCIIPHNIQSQKYRFPEVHWLASHQANRANAMTKSDCWIGVGDTPFQMTSGPWFLYKILNDVKIMSHSGNHMYMLGIGAEAEVTKSWDVVNRILDAVHYIWTRDKFTKDLLVDQFGFDSEKVSIGGDLANISLRNIFSNTKPISKRQYDLAVTYYSEIQNKKEINQLKKFIKHIREAKSTLFVGNEARKDKSFEYGIYRSMFGRFRERIHKKPVEYYVPGYDKANLTELVTHFQNYRVVMASRYHVLLAAAWAGCKLTALARSSKIEALAIELGIPLVNHPMTLKTLYDGYVNAKTVQSDKLYELAERAKGSIIDFCNRVRR